MADAAIVCTSCAVALGGAEGEDLRGEHYGSEWHRYNVKRRVAGLEPLTLAVYDARLAAVEREAEEAGRTFECADCTKTFRNEASRDQHMQSRKHLKKVESRSKHRRASERDADADADAGVDNDDNDDNDDENDDDDDDEGVAESVGTNAEGAVPVGSCLMTSRPFGSVEAALDHMLKKYGFFLPYVEELEDLDGLLEFLGEKVGVGHCCIYCHRRFRSVEAVRKHMEALGHCKLRFEEEEDLEEMEFFYNFDGDASDAGDEAKDGDGQLTRASDYALPPKEVSHLDEDDSLVMTDGTVIGHRGNRQLGRRALPERRATASRLSSQYRTIGLPGYNGRERGPVPRAVQRARNKERMKGGVRNNAIQKRWFRDQVIF